MLYLKCTGFFFVTLPTAKCLAAQSILQCFAMLVAVMQCATLFPLLWNRNVRSLNRAYRLEGSCGPKDQCIAEHGSYKLNTYWQTLVVKTPGKADRRLLREVEGETIGRPSKHCLSIIRRRATSLPDVKGTNGG